MANQTIDIVDINDLYIPTVGKNDKSLKNMLNVYFKTIEKNKNKTGVIDKITNKNNKANISERKKITPIEIGRETCDMSNEIYCMKCKEKTQNTGGVIYYLFPNGALNISCICLKCNGPKRSMIKKDKLPDKFQNKLKLLKEDKNKQ